MHLATKQWLAEQVFLVALAMKLAFLLRRPRFWSPPPQTSCVLALVSQTLLSSPQSGILLHSQRTQCQAVSPPLWHSVVRNSPYFISALRPPQMNGGLCVPRLGYYMMTQRLHARLYHARMHKCRDHSVIRCDTSHQAQMPESTPSSGGQSLKEIFYCHTKHIIIILYILLSYLWCLQIPPH